MSRHIIAFLSSLLIICIALEVDIDRERVEQMTRSRLEATLFSGRPLIISGGAANWSALSTWSLEWFEKRLPSSPVEFRDKGALYGGAAGLPLTLGTYRGAAASRVEPWYVGFGVQDEATFNAYFSPHMSLPPFFPASFAEQGFKTGWLYFGAFDSGVPYHTDPQCDAKYSVQVTGRKRWRLVDVWRRALAAAGGGADYDEIEWQGVMEPGDILIFFPQMHHATEVLSAEGSLAYTGYITTPRDTPLIRDFIAAAKLDADFDKAVKKCYRKGAQLQDMRAMCQRCELKGAISSTLRPEACDRVEFQGHCAHLAAGHIVEGETAWDESRGTERSQPIRGGVKRRITFSQPSDADPAALDL
jgi:hypothetical protein